MKAIFLPLIVAPLLFLSTANAQDWRSPLYPYNADMIYKEEAAPYIQHVEDTWRIYQVSRDNLNRIERLATAEYQTKKERLSPLLSKNIG